MDNTDVNSKLLGESHYTQFDPSVKDHTKKMNQASKERWKQIETDLLKAGQLKTTDPSKIADQRSLTDITKDFKKEGSFWILFDRLFSFGSERQKLSGDVREKRRENLINFTTAIDDLKDVIRKGLASDFKPAEKLNCEKQILEIKNNLSGKNNFKVQYRNTFIFGRFSRDYKQIEKALTEGQKELDRLLEMASIAVSQESKNELSRDEIALLLEATMEPVEHVPEELNNVFRQHYTFKEEIKQSLTQELTHEHLLSLNEGLPIKNVPESPLPQTISDSGEEEVRSRQSHEDYSMMSLEELERISQEELELSKAKNMEAIVEVNRALEKHIRTWISEDWKQQSFEFMQQDLNDLCENLKTLPSLTDEMRSQQLIKEVMGRLNVMTKVIGETVVADQSLPKNVVQATFHEFVTLQQNGWEIDDSKLSRMLKPYYQADFKGEVVKWKAEINSGKDIEHKIRATQELGYYVAGNREGLTNKQLSEIVVAIDSYRDYIIDHFDKREEQSIVKLLDEMVELRRWARHETIEGQIINVLEKNFAKATCRKFSEKYGFEAFCRTQLLDFAIAHAKENVLVGDNYIVNPMKAMIDQAKTVQEMTIEETKTLMVELHLVNKAITRSQNIHLKERKKSLNLINTQSKVQQELAKKIFSSEKLLSDIPTTLHELISINNELDIQALEAIVSPLINGAFGQSLLDLIPLISESLDIAFNSYPQAMTELINSTTFFDIKGDKGEVLVGRLLGVPMLSDLYVRTQKIQEALLTKKQRILLSRLERIVNTENLADRAKDAYTFYPQFSDILKGLLEESIENFENDPKVNVLLAKMNSKKMGETSLPELILRLRSYFKVRENPYEELLNNTQDVINQAQNLSDQMKKELEGQIGKELNLYSAVNFSLAVADSSKINQALAALPTNEELAISREARKELLRAMTEEKKQRDLLQSDREAIEKKSARVRQLGITQEDEKAIQENLSTMDQQIAAYEAKISDIEKQMDAAKDKPKGDLGVVNVLKMMASNLDESMQNLQKVQVSKVKLINILASSLASERLHDKDMALLILNLKFIDRVLAKLDPQRLLKAGMSKKTALKFVSQIQKGIEGLDYNTYVSLHKGKLLGEEISFISKEKMPKDGFEQWKKHVLEKYKGYELQINP